jgi:hypothetical protein
MSEYRARVEVGVASGMGTGGGEADVEFMRHLETVGEVVSLEQRWANSWATSLQTGYVNKIYMILFNHISSIYQRPQTTTYTLTLKKIKTVSSVYTHPHQTRTKGSIRSVQNQTHGG